MSERNIEEIALDLGEVYYIEKDAKTEKEGLRDDFFLAATLEETEGSLAQKTVEVPESITSEAQARDFAERYNAGWRVVKVKGNSVIIEEDPALKQYSIVVETPEPVVDNKGVEHPGYVITRTIVSGSAMLDDERLKVEDPGLYEAVTTYQYYDLIADAFADTDLEPQEVHERIEEMGLPLVFKSLDDLTEEQAESLKPYSYEGPRSPRLNVKYAKPEEIGQG